MRTCPHDKKRCAAIGVASDVWQVRCGCGACGPRGCTKADAIALWDALPRQEDAEQLRNERDAARTALHKIVIWADAYPPDVFPPYSDQSLAELNVLLKAHGYSLDALGAQMMRHVVEGVGEIARKALKEESDG